MDDQITQTLNIFYGCPEGFSTDDFYEEYLFICEEDHVKAKSKSQVVREVCKGTGLGIEERRIKYFWREKEDVSRM